MWVSGQFTTPLITESDSPFQKSFEMEIDGKKVTGVVKEKQLAKDNYEDAIAEGFAGFLLEQSRLLAYPFCRSFC